MYTYTHMYILSTRVLIWVSIMEHASVRLNCVTVSRPLPSGFKCSHPPSPLGVRTKDGPPYPAATAASSRLSGLNNLFMKISLVDLSRRCGTQQKSHLLDLGMRLLLTGGLIFCPYGC